MQSTFLMLDNFLKLFDFLDGSLLEFQEHLQVMHRHICVGGLSGVHAGAGCLLCGCVSDMSLHWLVHELSCDVIELQVDYSWYICCRGWGSSACDLLWNFCCYLVDLSRWSRYSCLHLLSLLIHCLQDVLGDGLHAFLNEFSLSRQDDLLLSSASWFSISAWAAMVLFLQLRELRN